MGSIPIEVALGVMLISTEEVIGFEWCIPNMYTESGEKPYSGYVAQKVNVGWVLLCRVSRDVNTGEIFKRPIKDTDLSVVEL